MKKLLLAALLFTLPATATAEETYCVAMSSVAENVMRARQAGVDIIAMVNLAKDAGEIKDVFTLLIEEAYSRTQFNTEQNKHRGMMEFKNDFYLACI